MGSPPSRRLTGAAAALAAGRQEGFTLIGLLVAIVVINVGLAVALTSWATLDKRAKEAELIWRGQQYVRALRCHQSETGAPPDALDELLESDCIRSLYPDPMNPTGQWRIIRQSDQQITQGSTGFGGDRTAAVLAGIDLELRGPEAFLGGAGGGRRAGARGGQTQLDSIAAARGRFQTLADRMRRSFGRSSGDGIIGVASTSTATALRMYKGEETYDAWRFVAQ